jgi:hypothetical protein
MVLEVVLILRKEKYYFFSNVMNVRGSQFELNPSTSGQLIKKLRRTSCSQIAFFQNLEFENHRLKVRNMIQKINLSQLFFCNLKKIQYFGGPKHSSISALPQAWTKKLHQLIGIKLLC